MDPEEDIIENEDETPDEENVEASEDDEDDDDLPEEGETDPDSTEETPAPRSAAKKADSAYKDMYESLRKSQDEQEQRSYQEKARREEELERQRLEAMPADERADYKATKLQQEVRGFMAHMAFQQKDMMDKSDFLNYVSSNPKFTKYQNEVETELAKMRKNGQTVPRLELLRYVIGSKAMAAATSGASTKQKKGGQKNIDKSKTRSTSSKGNVVSIGKKGMTLEKKLTGVFI